MQVEMGYLMPIARRRVIGCMIMLAATATVLGIDGCNGRAGAGYTSLAAEGGAVPAKSRLSPLTYIGGLQRGASWPKYHANNRNTGLGIGKGAVGALKWKFETDGDIVSSPAIGADGTIYTSDYISTSSGDIVSGHLYAINGATGAPKWKFKTKGGPTSPVIGADGTVYISDSVSTSNGDIVSGHLYAINGATGKLKWKFKTEGDPTSPLIGTDGNVYISDSVSTSNGDIVNGHLYAINGATGALKWKFKTKGGPTSPVMGTDDTVYIGDDVPVGYPSKSALATGKYPLSDYGYLYALNGSTGKLEWKFKTGGAIVSPPAIGADNTVYVGDDFVIDAALESTLYAIGKIPRHIYSYFYALNGETGKLKWKFRINDKWVVKSTSAIGGDGTIYIPVSPPPDGGDCYLYALDATAKLKWKDKFRADTYIASPVIGSDGTLYVVHENNGSSYLYALNDITGKLKWKFKTRSHLFSPAIGSDGTIYVGCGSELYAIR